MRNLLLFPAIVLLLSACGGNGGGDEAPLAGAANAITLPDTVRYQAVILQNNLSFGDETEVSNIVAVFTDFPNRAVTDLLNKPYKSEAGCKLTRQTVAEMAADQALLNAQYPLAHIANAGDIITVTAPTGTWPALEKIGSLGAAYSSDWGAELGLLPSGSTIQVPGDVFPAINEIALPFTEKLTGVEFLDESMVRLPVTEVATPAIGVRWDAAASSTSRMKLSLLNKEIDETGTLVSTSRVSCDIPDTGSYTFPAETKLLMDPQYEFRSLHRYKDFSETKGDTLIYVRSESLSLAVD